MNSKNPAKITKLYKGNGHDDFSNDQTLVKPKGRPKMLSLFEEDDKSCKVPIGLMAWASENNLYKMLVVNLKINDASLNELVEEVSNAYSLDLDRNSELSWALAEKSDYAEDNLFLFPTCIRWKRIPIESKFEIVSFYLLGKLSNKSISYLIKLEVDQIKWVIKHFQQACKNRSQINRTETVRGRQKLKAEHIDWLKTYLESQRNSRVVARSIKQEVGQKYPDILNISESTIKRTLKSKFNYSYKKLSHRNIKLIQQGNVRKYIQSAALINRLSEDDWELIYFDGFGWDSRRQEFYGYGTKGHKSYIRLFEDQIDASFLWALSKYCFYGVMGINGTTDSNCIIEFIRKVCLSRMKNHDRLDKKFMFLKTFKNFVCSLT